MSTHGTIKRYTLLLQRLSQSTHPSFTELKEFLEDHGFTISQRTLQRDIEQIRTEFGVEISYSRQRNGYTLSEAEELSSETLLKFLEILNTAELLADNLKNGGDILHFISFEHEGRMKGIDHLRLLIPAIKKKKKIEFSHENFETGQIKKHLLHPYLLREYQGRWYLIGTIGQSGNFRTFGLDRIRDLKIRSETYRPLQNVDPKTFFDDIIGLIYSESDIEEVQLKVDNFQYKYLQSLPLHRSQQLISKGDRTAVLRLFIRPNFEFMQKVMMLGHRAVILKPEWLANEMKQNLKKMLAAYQ